MTMQRVVSIGRREVGEGRPCFIIAEAGVNHDGSTEKATALIDAAAKSGADAVKFQTFNPATLIVRTAPKAVYQLKQTAASESQYEMLDRLALSPDAYRRLKAHADGVGITFLSTPYGAEDADLLLELGAPALKLASIDIVNRPLLRHCGRSGVPVIISGGMASLGEIETALQILEESGCHQAVLLHCVTNYPIEDHEANLRVIETLRLAFQTPVGYSDHTRDIGVPIAAVALGACVIEKHFTLDQQAAGPDHAASLGPSRFSDMVAAIRSAEAALGSPVKRPNAIEVSNRERMRRSIVAVTDIPAGTVLDQSHLALKRPGTGLGAESLGLFIGRRTTRAVQRDELLSLDVLLP
jgi:N,N'-diacetyllegionaminate synthase